MAEEQDKKQPAPPRQQPTKPQASEREVTIDTRMLSDAVIELNISRKNVSIYPPGHLQITKSIDRAFDVLMKMFEIRQEMTLGIAKDTLFVGQNYLDQRNPVYRDFALSLNQQGIAAVTFIRGLDRAELERFHRIITTKQEEIEALGGIAKVVNNAGIPHIRVMAIDYANFHLTEEKEIFKAQPKAGEKPGAGVWQDFVSLLSTGTLATGGEGVSLKNSAQIDPVELAKLLNERKLDSGAAVQSSDRIISSYVRTSAESKQLTKEQSETIANLNKMLKDLHPDIRKQFLSTAFKNVSENASSSGSEEVLGGLGDDMIIDMLRQASTEGREISPTLTGLLGKLASVRDRSSSSPSGGSGTAAKAAPGAGAADNRPGGGSVFSKASGTGSGASAAGKGEGGAEILPEHMAKLFDREQYETYVEKDYDDILKTVSERAGAMAATAGDRFPIDEYLISLGDQQLDLQIGRAVLAFMAENIDEEDYREFAKKLVAIVPDMLTSGHFALLLDTIQTLRWHLSDKKSEACRASAADALKMFWDQEFISKAVDAFNAWSRSKGKDASAFMLALGPILVPGLLDIFANDAAPGGRRMLFDLLCTFSQDSVNEAVKRLEDPRAFYVRNLLMLIRRAGTPTVIPAVKLLMKHGDPKVRLDALSVLLRFQDPGSVALLRQELNSQDPDVRYQAVSLAGQYRVTEVTEYVLGLLKKVILFETDYDTNEEIIRALGEIGDPRAIPDLEKMAKVGWSLYPKSHDRMKITLFESLGRYPKESIAELLRIGEQSGNDKIRQTCRKLMGRI